MPITAIRGFRSQNQLIFLLLSVLSCATSIALTINFCWHLRTETSIFAGLIAVAIGIAWECAKYGFAPKGFQLLYGEDRPTLLCAGLGLICVTIVLVLGSVCASMGFLLESDAESQRRTIEQSGQYQDARTQIASLDAEIALLQQTAKADLSHHYRKRAMGTLAQANALRTRRDTISSSLQQFESTPTLASPYFASLAGFLAGDQKSNARKIRLIAYAVVALMLEIISICAVTLFISQRKNLLRADFDTKYVDENVIPPSSKQNLDRGTCRGDTGTNGIHDTRYKEARRLIISRKISPSVRSVKAALKVSQIPARRFLKALQEEGVLFRTENNRYRLAREG